MRVFRFAVVVSAALVTGSVASEIACGPPDSFDGLVGGPADASNDGRPIDLKEDPSLPPPRPVSPLSGSWINGSRPRFRWQLAPNTTGARVELCRLRPAPGATCDGEKKTFEATGPEHPLEEDLAPGIWFWRLYSKTPETFGTTPSSEVRELLVRGGPAAKAEPSGSIIDLNGDGRADLVAVIETDGPDGGPPAFSILPLLASPEASTEFVATDGLFAPIGHADPALAGVDVDGDGFSDLLYSDRFADDQYEISMLPGSNKGVDFSRFMSINTPRLSEPPSLHQGGDLNGDGWGDVLLATSRDVFGALGTARGPSALSYVFRYFDPPADAGVSPPTSALALAGGFDRTNDGFSDVVFGWPYPNTPVVFFFGNANLDGDLVEPNVASAPLPTRATALASGDFDGDGLPDVAFVTTAEGKPAICTILATEPLPVDQDAGANVDCWIPEAAPAGFGSSITACDLDADGRDEVLVGSSSSGIDVVRRVAAGNLGAEHVKTAFGARLTAITPGRPEPAVWAATRADGSEIAVFKGRDQVSTVPRPEWAKRFGTALR